MSYRTFRKEDVALNQPSLRMAQPEIWQSDLLAGAVT